MTQMMWPVIKQQCSTCCGGISKAHVLLVPQSLLKYPLKAGEPLVGNPRPKWGKKKSVLKPRCTQPALERSSAPLLQPLNPLGFCLSTQKITTLMMWWSTFSPAFKRLCEKTKTNHQLYKSQQPATTKVGPCACLLVFGVNLYIFIRVLLRLESML